MWVGVEWATEDARAQWCSRSPLYRQLVLDAVRPHREGLATGLSALRDDRHETTVPVWGQRVNHRDTFTAVRVLSITHGPTVPGGVFDEAVETAGHTLVRWSVPEGAAPDPAREYDAVMAFGGSMHPDEDARFGWLAQEEEFLREALAERVPVFGVCLGAQMLARAAGATVRPADTTEIGWHEIELTPAGKTDPVLSTLPESATVFQWHHYTFDVPDRGAELARSALCTQAFGLGGQRAWGIQFHAEVTLPMLETWATEDSDELPVSAQELLEESASRISSSNAQGRALAAAFLREASSDDC